DAYDGLTLEDHVKEYGALTPEELVAVARQMAAGLEAAHRNRILHRNVKPSNVLVHKEAHALQVKLIDFGLTPRPEVLQELARRSQGADGAGDALAYTAPEHLGQAHGAQPSPAMDVYGFGKACCYALFRTPSPSREQWKSIAPPL